MRIQFFGIALSLMLVGPGALAQKRTNLSPSLADRIATGQSTDEGRVCPKQSFYSLELNGPVKTDIAIKAGDQISFSATGSVSFGAFASSGGPNGIAGFDAYK